MANKIITITEDQLRQIIRHEVGEYLQELQNAPRINVVHLHLNEELIGDTGEFLLEAKTYFNRIPNTKYSYRLHKVFGEQKPGHLTHAHIYSRGKEIFAMNVDGTAHDGYHQAIIPYEVADFLRSKGFTVPVGNIIEVVAYHPGLEQLLD